MKINEQLLQALNRCIQCCEDSIDECENFVTICSGNDFEDCAEAHVACGQHWKNCISAARACAEVCTAELKKAPADAAATLNECIEACRKCVKACEDALVGCGDNAEVCEANLRQSVRACNECAELCQAVVEAYRS